MYVDDFKMAGRRGGMAKAWKAITGEGRLALDEPTDSGPYLGCEQTRSSITAKEAQQRLQNILPLVSEKLAREQQELMSRSGDAAKRQIPSVRWGDARLPQTCPGALQRGVRVKWLQASP